MNSASLSSRHPQRHALHGALDGIACFVHCAYLRAHCLEHGGFEAAHEVLLDALAGEGGWVVGGTLLGEHAVHEAHDLNTRVLAKRALATAPATRRPTVSRTLTRPPPATVLRRCLAS